MESILSYLNRRLTELGIPYEYGEWTSPVADPYVIGEYTETEPTEESGEETKTIILTGTTRQSALVLEQISSKLQTAVPPSCGETAILENSAGIAVFYAGSFPVPVDVEGMRRIQINLTVKYWRVI